MALKTRRQKQTRRQHTARRRTTKKQRKQQKQKKHLKGGYVEALRVRQPFPNRPPLRNNIEHAKQITINALFRVVKENNQQENIDVSPEQILEWFRRAGFPLINDYDGEDPEIHHTQDLFYRIQYNIPENMYKNNHELILEAQLIADPDQNGNFPIIKTRNGEIIIYDGVYEPAEEDEFYLIAGDLIDGEIQPDGIRIEPL
jgi:hypothetical protein